MAEDDNVYVERRDPSRNMARFYALSVESDLFDGVVLVRRWGRIGTAGRMVRHHHSRADNARAQLQVLLCAKRRRGYDAAT
jgi:predicted DNA-binding WGR domain protein